MLFILMDFPIHIDTISMEESILYFKGLSVKISMKWCTSIPEDYFYHEQTVQTLTKCRSSSGSSLFAQVPVYRYLEWKGLNTIGTTLNKWESQYL